MSELKITVQGPVGSGKSALLGEIEILCKALGVPVRYAVPSDAASEKAMTHADWTAYLEMYKPSVVLHEKGPDRTALASAPVAGNSVCKGSMALGSGCGACERCKAELASAPVAGEAQIEVAKLAEELADLASDMAYEANQKMDQDKASQAALIERGERALRRFAGAAPQASTVAGEAHTERGDPTSPKDDSDRTYDRPIGYLPAYELGRLHSGHSANLRSAKFGPSVLDGDVPVYLEPPKGDAAPQASALAAEYTRGRVDGFDAGHSAALEKAAAALEDHRRAGREWVPGSLWDTLSREGAARIRALKQPQAAKDGGQQRAGDVDERAAFEAWVKAQHPESPSMLWREDDSYAYSGSEWKAWQARAALSATQGAKDAN